MRQINQIIQITSKLKLLSEVTFNLKCATFKIVDLPIETLKHKPISIETSLLTTLDSIFYDLKRVQTLLSQHSRKYPIKQNANFPVNQDLNKHKVSALESGINRTQNNHQQKQKYNFHRQTSQINFKNHQKKDYDQKTINLNKTKKITHLVQSSYDRTYNLINNNFQNDKVQINYDLLVPLQGARKSNQNINISKVSSTQYLGINQNPSINIIKSVKNKTINNSPPHSQISNSKVSVDWNSIHLEQHLKDKENQQFIQSIKRKRQLYLKSISKKKQKCFHTIDKINIEIVQEKQRSVSRGKERRKSKTEKFRKYQSQKNQKKQLKKNYQDQPKIQYSSMFQKEYSDIPREKYSDIFYEGA